MVDGAWGWLWDPNITWIGHHLVLRAGGLTECSDARPAPIRHRAVCVRDRLFTLPERTAHSYGNMNSWGHSPYAPECPQLFKLSYLMPVISGSVNNLRMCDSHARRPTTTIWARGEIESFGNPSDDLPILCWDLEALPTHHLPWARFGLRQPHWLILKARFH